jgi:hypothetical protein
MSEKRANHHQEPAEAQGAQPPHPEEPAEGSSEDVEAPGTERAGETDKAAEEAQPSHHPVEPAEGSEEDVQAPGAERAGS